LPAAYINRAIALQASGDTKAGIDDLTAALDLGSSETRVYFLRAKWRQAVGDVAGAAADRAEGLKRTPRDELSWVARAAARLNDDASAALADCEAALRINSLSQAALQNMAFLYGEKLDRPHDAIATLNRLIDLDSQNATFVASRGVYFARISQRASAVADAATALRLGNDAMTHYRVACIYAITSRNEAADAERALAELSLVLQKQPSLAALARRDIDLDGIRTARFDRLIEAATNLQTAGAKAGD
jgi:tetratricopeptide (TPR) repeat protein